MPALLVHSLTLAATQAGKCARAFLCLVACAANGFAAGKATADQARVTTALEPEKGHLIVDVRGVPPAAPGFFHASVEQTVRLNSDEIASELRLKVRVVQGRPEAISIGLSGDGDVIGVSGNGLRDWSVRHGGTGDTAERLLDLRPLDAPVSGVRGPAGPPEYEWVIFTRQLRPAVPGKIAVLIATPGDAVGFSSKVVLKPDAALDVRISSAAGLLPLDEPLHFHSVSDARLEVSLAVRGAAFAEADLLDAHMSGRVNEAAASVEFRLQARVRSQKSGARLRFLSGGAALRESAVGDGWHIELMAIGEKGFAYDLVCDREGVFALDVSFAAAIRERGDARAIEFTMPAGSVVPLQLEGIGAGVKFQSNAAVVPARSGEGWRGFLPADGSVSLAWKRTRDTGESALAFTSFEQTDVRIAAGLLRQTAQLSLRILQGKLDTLTCRLDGPGEILGVEGSNIVGWKVLPSESGRVLEVRFSRPLETQGALVIQAQTELGAWPARAEPLRITPAGGVRHSGFVRIANRGAVRLEVVDATGMMQLAPAQFPGAEIEKDVRQVFVYRFPSATYAYRVLATQIQPEIGVSVVATYELAETARVINAAIELDVREASIRDWTLRIPGDYAVVTLAGSDVADHISETAVTDGTRALRIMFGRAIAGRQLIELRLEKNQPAAAGDWTLPPLRFAGAKSVRGHIGAVTTPGFRLAPSRVEALVEVPLSFFPKQTPGLQQAWRIREPDWTAELRVDALGQSVQADVFHLYSLKEGVVAASVLLNYFVVGAPVNEWRIEVPATVGNIDVIGQNVRRDWRREGGVVIVSLHQPVLGAATLLITFEEPMSARGGMIAPGQVRPLGVQAERGFIQVVSPLQVKHEVRRAEGALLRLEPTELPAEFRLFTSSPSLAVFQYTGRPFNFEMGVEWYAPGETVDQVIDFAKLVSQVSRDGQVVTEATLFVKSRGRQVLRFALPEGVKLWEARVDQEVVSAREDGDQTLVPLPARLNPNEPVAVVLRLGQPAPAAGTTVRLAAPRAVTAPTVISEWTLRSEDGRLLVPAGGSAGLLRPALTETGFEWIATRGFGRAFALVMVIGLGALLLHGGFGWRVPAGLAAHAIAVAVALLLAGAALVERRPNLRELTFASTVVPAGETVALQMANVPDWRAMLVGWGLVALVAGVAASVTARRVRRPALRRVLPVLGIVLLAVGVLAQRGGAAWFFGAVSWGVFLRILVPGVMLWRRERQERNREEPPPPAEPGSGIAPVISALAIAGLIGLNAAGGGSLQAAERFRVTPTPSATGAPPSAKPAAARSPDGTKAAQSVVQAWSIRGERVFATIDLTVRGGPGDSFLLLRAPAVLTGFDADGLRVSKIELGGQAVYTITPDREGTLTARARFELPWVDRTKPILLPTGPAAAQRVTLELDQAGWEFTSPMAVQILPAADLPEGRSSATLVLAPHAAPTISLQPRRRDLGAETTQFFAEAANLYVPAPGVVNGFTRVTIRPVQGRVSTLELQVPAGLTVGEVARGPVGAWRFDPGTRRLHVAVEPAQSERFTFDVETQLGAGELPFALGLEPLRILGAAGDVGMIALAFGGDAQPEGIRVSELSAVSAPDFEATLLPRTREGQPVATLQNVWRYGAAGGRVELTVAAVSPEVRVATRQVLSLDDDRMVMAVDLRVAIARVGLFKLSFALPEGLEVEALSGAALNHWTEAPEGTQRIVTLHLNERTIGEHAFNLALAGAAPRAQDAWPFPRLVVREATRQTGEALVVPGKGIRLRAVEREKVTQLDPRTVGGQQPGTLAFRLLQPDWILRLGIETLEAWVTVQSLQEHTLREGQTLTRMAVRYRVENATLKQVQLNLPGLSAAAIRTVRATGPAVSDIVKVDGAEAPDRWEIHFQRGIAGETDVQIEYQTPTEREGGQEAFSTPEFIGARQSVQFVAIRAGGRIELAAPAVPRGWVRIDWSAVPIGLQHRSERSMPALCFRVAEPEGALSVSVRRHEVAAALKLRVTQADLLTLFAPSGEGMTAVELKVDVIEKSTLRVRLPDGAQLFNTRVNGESAAVVRDGDAWLFHVAPGTAGERHAAIRLVYAAAGSTGGRVALAGPGLSVPLENVTWRVVLPPGYELDDYGGALRLREERVGHAFGLDQYVSAIGSKRSAETKEAMSILQQAGSWMQKGEQDKAAEALARVSNGAVLDQATNEDARVQLRNLKTQQAVLGLNTRRQKLYFDHRADAAQNPQLEAAANLNPFFQGKLNFDPGQAEQLLLGNTAEENSALRGIATRIVDQQLGVEAAPGAIEVTLPERGRVLTFTRSLQVNGSTPLELSLDIRKIGRGHFGLSALLLLGIAAIAAIELGGKKGQGARD